MKQVDFSLFAATQAASLCPPAGAVQTANDVFALVAQPGTSGQRVDTRTHKERRAARVAAFHLALVRRSGEVLPRFVLVHNTLAGPVALPFIVRPDGPIASLGCCAESLHRIRSAA